MTQHGPLLPVLAAAIGVLLFAPACGGSDSKKDQTSTPAPAIAASSALKTTAAASGTVAALRTAAAGITVLPGGTAVTAGGTAVPAALATEVASLPTSGPTQPSGATPASGSTTLPRPTEIPLCVADPTVPNCATPPPAPTPVDAAAQGIAMDANPSTADIETGDITVAAGQNFTVGLNIVTAPAPYQGYSWDIIMEGPIAYVSEVPSSPAGLTTCAPANTVVGGEIYGGCFTTKEPVTYTGPIGTVTFRCTGAGAGSLRLRRPSDPGNAGFDTELILPDAGPLTDEVGPPIKVVCS